MIIRTSETFSNNSEVSIFGAFHRNGQEDTHGWTSQFCAQSFDAAVAMNGTNNALGRTYSAMNAAAWDFAECVPAAVTVQVINPEALQTTAGTVFAGRLRTLPSMIDRSITWRDFANNFLSYNAPRVCSAAKLALRGIQMDGAPYDMSSLASFQPRKTTLGGAYSWDGTTTDVKDNSDVDGFGPMIVYNQGSGGIRPNLTYIVTPEWPGRSAPSNPAQPAAQCYPPPSHTPPSPAIKALDDVGNGAVDIVERVAAAGQFASKMYNTYKGLTSGSQSLLALTA